MLLGNHVLDVEGKEVGVIFVQAAVFTAMAGPLSDESAERGIYYSSGQWARSWRAFDLRNATKVA
jgi:hypothetical protein